MASTLRLEWSFSELHYLSAVRGEDNSLMADKQHAYGEVLGENIGSFQGPYKPPLEYAVAC